MNSDERLHQAELRKVKRLRDYYRVNFSHGQSDAAFLIWIEQRLAELGNYSLDEAATDWRDTQATPLLSTDQISGIL